MVVRTNAKVIASATPSAINDASNTLTPKNWDRMRPTSRMPAPPINVAINAPAKRMSPATGNAKIDRRLNSGLDFFDCAMVTSLDLNLWCEL
jgi:hypothetical protein